MIAAARFLLPYALAALVCFGGGWTVKGWKDGAEIAAAHAAAERINAIVARREADLERIRADANAKAALEARRQAARVTDLTARLAAEAAARAAADAKLKEVLAHATDAVPLSDSVLRWLDGVRQQQHSAYGQSNPPASRAADP